MTPMKYLIIFLLVSICYGNDYLKKYNDQLIDEIEKIDNEHKIKTIALIKEHLAKLQKLQIYYTKQGNLDKALEVKSAIKALDIDKNLPKRIVKPEIIGDSLNVRELINSKWIFKHNNVIIKLLNDGSVKGTPNKKWHANITNKYVQIGDYKYKKIGNKLVNEKFSLTYVGKDK